MKIGLTGFLREYVASLSIITIIIGFVVLFMGVIWIWAQGLQLGFYTDIISNLGSWNYYLLVIGLIIFGIGLWYLYSYLKTKKFVLDELKTNKRSEFIRRHGELKEKVKHLPFRYKKIVNEKEKEFRIK